MQRIVLYKWGPEDKNTSMFQWTTRGLMPKYLLITVEIPFHKKKNKKKNKKKKNKALIEREPCKFFVFKH